MTGTVLNIEQFLARLDYFKTHYVVLFRTIHLPFVRWCNSGIVTIIDRLERSWDGEFTCSVWFGSSVELGLTVCYVDI
jgi:hypothetical protein